MTAEQKITAPTEEKRRGFPRLVCVRCGEAGGLSIELDDLDDGEALHCRECEADFALDDVREIIEAWAKVIAWCATAPTIE